MFLVEMGHVQPPIPAVTDNATGDGFVNDKIFQRRSRAIDVRFYWVRDRVRQRQFLVHLIDGEHNLARYFTNHHPTSHHQSQRSIYLVPTVDASKYSCYMSPIDLLGCFESLPIRVNRLRTDIVSLLREEKTDDVRTDKNSPNRLP